MNNRPVSAGFESVRAAGVVGREAEQAHIGAFVDAVGDGVRALVIRGDPGIGKTTLWQQAVQACERAGYEVLVTRPAEEELSLALAGLVDLFEHHASDVPVLQAQADPLVRGRALLAALRLIAESRPVLVAIDDLQWLDSASARALRYALRRLDAEPVGVLATTRLGSTPEDPLAMADLLPPGRFDAIDLGPLSLAEVRRLMGRIVATISPRTLRRIHEVSGGNPLFALELARPLATDDRAARSPGGLRLPDSMQAAILRRLESVPVDLAPLLETASALARTSVRELRETVPDADVDALIALAERHGLLVVDEELEVRFSHPLIGSVVYGRMSPLARRSLHDRLARRAGDPDLRAHHLALCTDEPDAEVADLLAQAAQRASDRGALGLAAEFAEHSVRLTPPEDTDAARGHALDHIGYLTAAGEPVRALRLADGLVARLPPGPGRAEALVQRAQLEDDDLETGESLLVRALEDAGADAPLRGRVLDQLGWLRGIFRGDLPAGIECAREALAVADAVGDPEFQMSAAAGLSNMQTLAGTPRPELMARAVALEDEIGRPPLWAGPRVLLGEQRLWAGDLLGARALLEAAVADAANRNHERWLPYSLYDLASVESAAGNLVKADGLLRQALELARDCEDAHVESWIFYRHALAATWLGRAEEARAAAKRRLDAGTRRGERPGIARARSVLGLLALSEGDTATAAGELGQSVGLLDEMGFAHPGAIPALPDAIEAFALTGDGDAAQQLLEQLEGQAARVGSAWALAALDRAHGVVAFAQGKTDAAVASLRTAASAFAGLGFRPDAARAVLIEGRALLRAGQRTAAADALARARDAFAEMGAALWEARAAEELDRAAPGRAVGGLTPAESRIAALVARGAKNREIAQALFMSVATVEAHLTRVYRKLDIRSRSELTRLVTDGSVVLSGRATLDGDSPAPTQNV